MENDLLTGLFHYGICHDEIFFHHDQETKRVSSSATAMKTSNLSGDKNIR